jgi:hypothetical protein
MSDFQSLIIREPRAMQASSRICATMQAHGGQWVPMYIEDGWVLARADSPRGQQLLRSNSPTIAGVFDGTVRRSHLRDALCCAMRGESVGVPRRTYPNWERRAAGAYKRAWRSARRELGLKAS